MEDVKNIVLTAIGCTIGFLIAEAIERAWAKRRG